MPSSIQRFQKNKIWLFKKKYGFWKNDVVMIDYETKMS